MILQAAFSTTEMALALKPLPVLSCASSAHKVCPTVRWHRPPCHHDWLNAAHHLQTVPWPCSYQAQRDVIEDCLMSLVKLVHSVTSTLKCKNGNLNFLANKVMFVCFRYLRPSMLQHLLRRLVFDVPILNEYAKMPLKVCKYSLFKGVLLCSLQSLDFVLGVY